MSLRESRPLKIAVALCAVCVLSACASGPKDSATARYMRGQGLKTLPHFDIPIVVNNRVEMWIDYFQGAGRGHFTRYLERSGRYIPFMREILKQKGLPEDLVYIALIESGFNNRAYSRASAVGSWQFIRSTGRLYRLKVDNWVDERRDPVKATEAAAEFYRDLYAQFGDWYLAMAAYNGGPVRVERAIAMTGSRDFWRIANNRRALRPETRDYVPKFIAAAIIAKQPERFGFGDIGYHDPLDFDMTTVDTQTDLRVIAKCADVDYEEVADLNPHLVRGATPAGMENYEIRLPKGTTKLFRERYALLPKEERIQIVRHHVRRGETLVAIARRYSVDPNDLARANNLGRKSFRRLGHGRTLIIPIGASTPAYARADKKRGQEKIVHVKRLIRHKVAKGETVGRIASRYGVTIAQVRGWNGLGRKSSIRAGQRLKIYRNVARQKRELAGKTTAVSLALLEKSAVEKGGDGLKTAVAGGHKVAKGETLESIASRYGVTTKDLLMWNFIKDPKKIKIGQVLKVGEGNKAGAEDAGAGIPVSGHISTDAQNATPAISTAVEGPQASISNASMENKIGAEDEVTAILKGQLEPVQNVQGPIKLGGGTAPKASGALMTYKVKNGDTLWGIARKHNVSISDIQKWNSLSDPSAVKPGTEIKIQK